MKAAMATRALLVLGIVDVAHAVLHAGLAVDKAGALTVRKPTAQDTEAHAAKATCTPLESFSNVVYTVRVSIGSPAQGLDVVVDTGSNLLVAESCRCKDQGYCDPGNKCFQEAKSKTLAVNKGPKKDPFTKVLNFGSGSILAEVANDVVHVGKASTKMQHGVLLMIDKSLDFNGPFEGILGLGPPDSKVEPRALRKVSVPAPSPVDPRNASGEKARWWHRAAASNDPHAELVIGAGFMQQAGMSRFSLCLADGTGEGNARDAGELRFEPPQAPQALMSVGTMHWGLDFRGISVGDSSTKLGFCSGAGMPRSQLTPCGAIPDSGSTFILGPQDQIGTLFSEICSRWPRCSGNHTALAKAAKRKAAKKDAVFRALLQDCESWMGKAVGMSELPPIHFHVADDTGLSKTLTLDGSLYTVSIREPDENGHIVPMCRAAFESLDYPTAHNGPAWILGMPIFHQYTVGFNVAAKPPTISFTKGQCGNCGNKKDKSLVKAAASGSDSLHRPLKVADRPRIPKIDITQPF